MNVKQNLSILFYLKRKKTSKDGKAPIYIRITVDGLEDEMSLSCKVLPDQWDNESKQVSDKAPDYVRINKTISQAKTDLERHFDLMQANGLVSPTMVKQSYLTPVSGQQQRNEKQANLQLSEALDALILEYLAYCDKVKKAHAEGRAPGPNKRELLDRKKVVLKEKMDGLAKKANALFDKKEHQKTFLLIVNDYLLHFMQLALAGHRSPNTLEKWYGRKKRYQEFLAFRYKLEDIPLADLKYSFIEEVFKFLLVQYEVIENTATKYAQCVKEMMDRAIAKGWIPANIFVIFKCAYDDTDAVWLTWGEMEALIKSRFKKEKLYIPTHRDHPFS
jgi:Arm DNA-binding domain/Phage integrase SAM-like domain